MNTFNVTDLENAISLYLSQQGYPGMFSVSMDHSPSEQLDESQEWHTSVLVLSPALEHASLALAIAENIRSASHSLRKWNRASKSYRKSFQNGLETLLSDFPVMILAISARREQIIKSENHFVSELGLSNSYDKKETNEKTRCVLGPFVKDEEKPYSIKLSWNRAIMSLFVFHFIRRMYQVMHRNYLKANKGCLNWNMLVDKFPGPIDEDMSLFVRTLFGMHEFQGRMVWGHFTNSDTDQCDLLTDNIAGLLSGLVKDSENDSLNIQTTESNSGKGLFYWEKWV